jgi:hypothetical protein
MQGSDSFLVLVIDVRVGLDEELKALELSSLAWVRGRREGRDQEKDGPWTGGEEQ